MINNVILCCCCKTQQYKDNINVTYSYLTSYPRISQGIELSTYFLQEGNSLVILLYRKPFAGHHKLHVFTPIKTTIFILLFDKSHILEKLIAAHPLETDDITQLFNPSDWYIVPYLYTNYCEEMWTSSVQH